MRFLSVITGAEDQGPPPPGLMAAMEKHIAKSFGDGSLIQTGGLARSSSGVRVRMSAGKLTVVDGPFTETKEVIGGYALLEAPSREAVIEATRAFMQLHLDHWPSWEGECEVRELVFLAP